MPRRSSTSAPPDWNALYELAASQAGYLSSADAQKAGYSLPLLHYYQAKGRIEWIRRGVYRLAHFPTGEHEDLVALWLWSGKKAVVSHETALMLHDLSDALPAKRHLTVPSAWARRRIRVPRGVVLHAADLEEDEVTWVGPVRVTTPLRTIRDCLDAHASSDLVEQAIDQALSRGLMEGSALARAVEEHGIRVRQGRSGKWFIRTVHPKPSRPRSKQGSARKPRPRTPT